MILNLPIFLKILLKTISVVEIAVASTISDKNLLIGNGSQTYTGRIYQKKVVKNVSKIYEIR